MSSSFTLSTESNDGSGSGPPTVWIMFAVFVGLCVVGCLISACCCGYQQRRQVTVETQLPDGSTMYVNVVDVQPSLHNQHHHALMDHHNHHHADHMAAVNNAAMASTIY